MERTSPNEQTPGRKGTFSSETHVGKVIMKRNSYQEQIARLKEEQDRAIKETDEQMMKWFVDDKE